MLYQSNKESELQKELFENPTSEYRGTPFWAWNCSMNRENVDYTIEALQDMGMGGGHIHCRTGMDLEYMGKDFMELVRYSNDKFKEKDMLTWLYDEDRWPSGAGGGIVTKESRYRMRFLVFSPDNLDNKRIENQKLSSSGQAVRSENRTLLARYGVKLEDGYLADYKRLGGEEILQDGYKEWFAYLEISGDNPWFNNQAYLNTLDQKAVERFIEVTHERYFEELGQEFGKTIPAIFTDEPQFSHKNVLGFAEERKEITIPFTDDFEGTFKAAYGDSILDQLPELFWELGEDRYSAARYHYHDHICERFVNAFADTVGNWCKEHGILLAGHMMEEPTLKSQTAALGEAMRSYRSFTLPGVDMLCDRRELSTVKQAQSAARQYGREGVLSELYGVTNWDFDFRGHKLQGDWQAALGVTVRVHHLTWTSMAGEAKRDYPAAIGYQSPWYREYPYVENYFARINTALTRGSSEVKVGVIHPIESYWLYWGTEEKTGGIRREMDEKFEKLINWLLYGLIDFDFISESLLPELNDMEAISGSKFHVGKMNYDVIVVPNLVTIRGTTLRRLERFLECGGKVIIAGGIPKLVDALSSGRPAEILKKSTQVGFNRYELLKELEPYRDLDIRNEQGIRTDNIIHQLRRDKEDKWLFLAHVNKMDNPDIPVQENLTITVKGIWKIVIYDAVTGNIREQPCEYHKDITILHQSMFGHDSLLIKLVKAGLAELKIEESSRADINNGTVETKISIPSEIPAEFSEPNVYMLDLAEYRFDTGEWQSKEEVLRIDNQFRKKLGYPLRMEAFAQPWTDKREEGYEHMLSLKFEVQSETDILLPKIALENAGMTILYLNGEKIEKKAEGWYADRDIKVVSLPVLHTGKNVIVAEIPYNSKTNVEVMYLLGDFGVKVSGSSLKLTKPVKKIGFGDITSQGLPFYGGNISYNLEIDTKAGDLAIQVPQFRNPLIKVYLDGEEKGYIAYSPYVLEIKNTKAGKHKLQIVAFGNRVNTFGPVHNSNRTESWIGPNAWRTTGTSWAYEYQLKPTGILISPEVTVRSF